MIQYRVLIVPKDPAKDKRVVVPIEAVDASNAMFVAERAHSAHYAVMTMPAPVDAADRERFGNLLP